MHVTQVMKALEEEKLYGNLEKCSFFSQEVTFLGYVVMNQGVIVDESKVEAIRSWLFPSSIHDVRSFHSLPSFYG